MHDDSLVSVITPCYNDEKYISETIESVLKQSYSAWEMIIIDDGSTDTSPNIIAKYQKKDSRIKFLRQKNKGSAAARNEGLRHAKGRYICLLDADDVWKPNFLSSQIKFMKKNHTVCVFSSYERIDENSNTIQHVTHAKPLITIKNMRIMNEIGCLTGVYDSSKYGKIYLDERLNSIRDDYAYWYKIVALENKAYGNPKVLARYRVFANSTTGNKKDLIPKQYKFYRNYLGENSFVAIKNVIIWGINGLKKFY